MRTVEKRKDQWEHHRTGYSLVGYGTTKENAETDWENKHSFLYGPGARPGETFSRDGHSDKWTLRMEGSSLTGQGMTPEAARADRERQITNLRRAKECYVSMDWNTECSPAVTMQGEYGIPVELRKPRRAGVIEVNHIPDMEHLRFHWADARELASADVMGYGDRPIWEPNIGIDPYFLRQQHEQMAEAVKQITSKIMPPKALFGEWDYLITKTNKAMNTAQEKKPTADELLEKENLSKLGRLNNLMHKIQEAQANIKRMEGLTNASELTFRVGSCGHADVILDTAESHGVGKEALMKLIALKRRDLKGMQKKFNKQMAAVPAVK